MTERIIERTVITPCVTVVTSDVVGERDLIGIHATLRTYILNMKDVDPDLPVATYINETAASLGHHVVVAETTRTLVERNAIEKYGIHFAIKEGAL